MPLPFLKHSFAYQFTPKRLCKSGTIFSYVRNTRSHLRKDSSATTLVPGGAISDTNFALYSNGLVLLVLMINRVRTTAELNALADHAVAMYPVVLSIIATTSNVPVTIRLSNTQDSFALRDGRISMAWLARWVTNEFSYASSFSSWMKSVFGMTLTPLFS